jgi:hypothetical protein
VQISRWKNNLRHGEALILWLDGSTQWTLFNNGEKSQVFSTFNSGVTKNSFYANDNLSKKITINHDGQ